MHSTSGKPPEHLCYRHHNRRLFIVLSRSVLVDRHPGFALCWGKTAAFWGVSLLFIEGIHPCWIPATDVLDHCIEYMDFERGPCEPNAGKEVPTTCWSSTFEPDVAVACRACGRYSSHAQDVRALTSTGYYLTAAGGIPSACQSTDAGERLGIPLRHSTCAYYIMCAPSTTTRTARYRYYVRRRSIYQCLRRVWSTTAMGQRILGDLVGRGFFYSGAFDANARQ